MGESNQNPLSCLSSQQLLEDLENFVVLESKRKGNPWISSDRLTDFFYQKYGCPPEAVAAIQTHSSSLKNFLKSSKRFSIYSTQIPNEFYIALLQEIVPGFQPSQTGLIPYLIKRPWKVDWRLLDILEAEGVEENSLYETKNVSPYQPILVSEIKSIADLEIALTESIKSLTGNNPKTFVTIATLSKKFSSCYQQPIRAVMRTICPGVKLIDLLQTIPNLNVQNVNNEWQVSVQADSID